MEVVHLIFCKKRSVVGRVTQSLLNCSKPKEKDLKYFIESFAKINKFSFSTWLMALIRINSYYLKLILSVSMASNWFGQYSLITIWLKSFLKW